MSYNTILNIQEELEMPKNNKTLKHDGRLFKQKVPATLRIGNRKSGTSAHCMTTEALLNVLTAKGQERYRSDAATVLTLRGVAFEWPAKLAA